MPFDVIFAGKEKEVLAMENGGNNKVNAIFEARLNGPKPNNHADLNTRERFIRDKYERRKFYDPAAFAKVAAQPRAAAPAPRKSQPQTAHAPSFDADFSKTESSGSVGVPSAAARRRLEARRSSSNLDDSRSIKQPSRSKSSTSNPVGDLLDFSNDPAPSDRSVARKKSNEKLVDGRGVTRRKSKDSVTGKKPKDKDLLAFDDAPAPAPATAGGDFAAFASPTPTATTAPAPAPAPKASSQDIMALYGGGAARAPPMNNGGMNMNMQTGQMNQMMQQMSLQNQQQQAMGVAQNQAQMQQQAMMYQQHMMRLQQMQAAGMQQGMMGNNMGGGGFVGNPQQQQMNMMQQRGMVSSDGNALQGGLASMASAGSSQNSDASNDPFASLGANGFR